MGTENLCLKVLEQRGIKSTAIRVLVLKATIDAEQAVSLLDLENKLDTVDKSSISRMIILFIPQHLAYSIDDGTGPSKCVVCDSECACVVKNLHTHLYCEYCHKTSRLENIHVPVAGLPEGLAVRSIDYVLKGCYAECAVEPKKGH